MGTELDSWGQSWFSGTELVFRDRAKFSAHQSQLASLFPSAPDITAVVRDFASWKDLLSIE